MKFDLKKLDPRGKIGMNAPVTLGFSLVSLIVLILGALTDGRVTRLLFSVYRASAADPLLYMRLFLHVLGHTSFSHYASNMAFLLVLGPIVEEKYGSGRLAAMIAAAAAVTGLSHILLSSGTAVMGASGIVFMLIFLAAASGKDSGKIPLTLILAALIYLGREVADGLFATDGISQLSHIIGGCCGIVFGVIMKKIQR